MQHCAALCFFITNKSRNVTGLQIVNKPEIVSKAKQQNVFIFTIKTDKFGEIRFFHSS